MAAERDFELTAPDEASVSGVVTGEEDSFVEQLRRHQFAAQYIGDPSEGRLQSRPDERTFYQTSWAGGAVWEVPLLGPHNQDTYAYGQNMDGGANPGLLLPSNRVTVAGSGIQRRLLVPDTINAIAPPHVGRPGP